MFLLQLTNLLILIALENELRWILV